MTDNKMKGTIQGSATCSAEKLEKMIMNLIQDGFKDRMFASATDIGKMKPSGNQISPITLLEYVAGLYNLKTVQNPEDKKADIFVDAKTGKKHEALPNPRKLDLENVSVNSSHSFGQDTNLTFHIKTSTMNGNHKINVRDRKFGGREFFPESGGLVKIVLEIELSKDDYEAFAEVAEIMCESFEILHS